MMTNKIIILILFNISFYISFSQENRKSIGFFDNDIIEDSIEYKFFTNQIDGPYYKCIIICGNGKKYTFDLGVSFESMQIHQGDKNGCIETYQWKTGDNGFEINETYIYKKEYDNWILQKSETVYQNGKTEIYKPDLPTGIDGTEYSKQQTNIEGLYVLKSCQNSRFKILIIKKEKQYLYRILDKKKTIKKGEAIVSNNKEYVSIMLGTIGGVFSGKDIQIQNYGNAMNEFIHFTQCDERYLTFKKTQ